MPLSLSQYQGQKARIRELIAGQLGTLWATLPDYRDASVDRFVRIAVPKVQAGQISVARATASFLGGPVLPREQIVGVRANVTPQVEYRRPAVKVYTELSNGASIGAAVEAGGVLLDSLLSTDIQLASTHQAQYSLGSQGYAYYVRVLTGSENCARCMIASTQRYHVADLLPIHPGCDCGVDKVPADFDPGQVIDPALLEATHEQVGAFAGISDRGGRNPDYLDLLVTHEHGEYGPTLAWRSDHFTGPSDVPIVLDGVHK